MSKGKHIAGKTWQTGGDPFRPESGNTKKKKKGRGGKIALCVVLALVLAGTAAWLLLFREPDVSGNDRPGVQDKNQSPGVDGVAGSEPDAAGSGRKEDYFTFLLLGKDTSSGSTDTIILVSYDVVNQQVNMMSIPRDTAVNVPWSVKKINSVYSAKKSSGGGLENLKKQVGYLTGVVPDFYVLVEWEAVGKIVEAVGGVEFDVPRNMNYDDPYQDLHIHIDKGLQTLDGEQAMGVIRYRHDNRREDGSMPGYADGDLGRTRTQQAFLKAMAKKVLQLGNMTKVGEFVKIFMDHVETDLKLSDLMWFASKALGMDADTIQSCTMPNEAHTFRGGSYVFANGAELVDLVNRQFNPYGRDVTEADLQLMVRHKDGTASVTNGELLDSRWAKAYSSSGGSKPKDEPASEPVPPETETEPGAEPEPGTETDPGTEPGAEPEPGTDLGTDPGETTPPEGGDPADPAGTPEEPALPPEETGGEPAPAGPAAGTGAEPGGNSDSGPEGAPPQEPADSGPADQPAP